MQVLHPPKRILDSELCVPMIDSGGAAGGSVPAGDAAPPPPLFGAL